MTVTVQTRKAVFETNSSSSHSLTLSNNDFPDQLSYSASDIATGELHVAAREFGWEWCRYHLLVNKLAYFLADQATHVPCTAAEMTANDFPEDIKRVLNVLETHLGVTIVVAPQYDSYSSGYSMGSVDHESVGTASSLVSGSDADVIRFFTQRESYVETGNDNSSAPRKIWRDIEGSTVDVFADIIRPVSVSYNERRYPVPVTVIYGDDDVKDYVLNVPGLDNMEKGLASLASDALFRHTVVDYVTVAVGLDKHSVLDAAADIEFELLSSFQRQGICISEEFRVITIPDPTLKSSYQQGAVFAYPVFNENQFHREIKDMSIVITGMPY